MSSAAPVRAGIAFWIWALFVYFGGLKPYGFRVNHGPLGLSRVQCTVSISLPRRYDFIGRPRFVVRASLCFSLKISTHRSHTYFTALSSTQVATQKYETVASEEPR